MAPIIHSSSRILPDPTPTSRPSSTSLASIFSTQSKYVMTNLPNRRVYVTGTLPSSSSSATSTNILAKAVATTHLSWWQLLALVLGAFLVLIVGIWLWWRHREKIKVEEAKKEEIEERERKRIASEKQKELVERMGGIAKGGKEKNKGEESESDSEMWPESETETDTGSENDDYISDGGTIRPSRTRRRKVKGRRRRKRRRGRHKFGHRRRSEIESMTQIIRMRHTILVGINTVTGEAIRIEPEGGIGIGENIRTIHITTDHFHLLIVIIPSLLCHLPLPYHKKNDAKEILPVTLSFPRTIQ